MKTPDEKAYHQGIVDEEDRDDQEVSCDIADGGFVKEEIVYDDDDKEGDDQSYPSGEEFLPRGSS